MANYNTNADILSAAKDLSGIQDTSDFDDLALESYNGAVRSMLLGGLEFVDPKDAVIFPFAVAQWPKVVNLEPSYETGTVSVTSNSTSLTFSATIAATRAGWFFKVDNHPDVFRVSAHTAGSASATLDAAYTGDTNAAAAYKLFKLRYQVGSNDIHALVDPIRVYREPTRLGANLPGEIEVRYGTPISPDELKNVALGVPNRAYVEREADGNVDISFNAYPSSLTRIELPYVPIPSDLGNNSNEPPVPPMYRHVLAHMVAYFILFAKSDARVTEMHRLARQGLRGMIAEFKGKIARGNRNWGRPIPRQDQVGGADELLRTESGMIIG